MQNIYPHWDYISLIFYCVLGLIGGICIYYAKNGQPKGYKIIRLPYIIWFLVWEIAAVFRYVGSFIGGADALAYINYFEECLDPYSKHLYATHVDFLYKCLSQFIRFFTSNYYILFIVIYAIIIFSYIVFIEEFYIKGNSCIPLTILFYIYLRGFTSIRTNLSVAMVLFSIVALNKNKKYISVILAIASCFMQKASLIYAAFFIFYYYYKKKNLRIKTCALWTLVAALAGKFMQYIIANINIPFLESGAYRWYAVYSQEGMGFFDNFWKIAFPQMVLAVALIFFNKDINRDIKYLDEKLYKKIYFIKILCYYDIILIPITYILNIWRGYEYLYIVRLVMWGEIIKVIQKKITPGSRVYVSFIILFLFITWMVFRIYNTWEDSGLMPYVFKPFLELI